MSDIELLKGELRKTISLYKSEDITLNKAIQRMEAILCQESMKNIKQKIWSDLSDLEEFNAYLVNGGENTQDICKKIESFLQIIEKKLT